MKYCTQCGTEYEDGVTRCADDGETELVSIDELHQRGLHAAGERDTRKFIRAGTAEDPLSAEQVTRALDQAGVPVFARPRRTGTVDNITGGTAMPWWEILVPEEHLARATALLAEARAEMESNADDAGRAAEEEFDNPPG
jgi:hypothetical protein